MCYGCKSLHIIEEGYLKNKTIPCYASSFIIEKPECIKNLSFFMSKYRTSKTSNSVKYLDFQLDIMNKIKAEDLLPIVENPDFSGILSITVVDINKSVICISKSEYGDKFRDEVTEFCKDHMKYIKSKLPDFEFEFEETKKPDKTHLYSEYQNDHYIPATLEHLIIDSKNSRISADGDSFCDENRHYSRDIQFIGLKSCGELKKITFPADFVLHEKDHKVLASDELETVRELVFEYKNDNIDIRKLDFYKMDIPKHIEKITLVINKKETILTYEDLQKIKSDRQISDK